ncbi:MAG: galactokinase [Myxococcota bacterium]
MRRRAIARAPGRVNLIGEHTDYHGGWVLPAAISLGTRVEVCLRDGAQVIGRSRELAEVAAGLAAPAAGDWLDYPRGVALELADCGRVPARGFELRVESELPIGAGLASSAALCVATALALAAAAGRPFGEAERAELARLCQRAESRFAGVPCGIMDPWAALFGRPGAALRLRCSDAWFEPVALPERLELLMVDTGVRHSLRDGRFALRQRECAQALQAARRVASRDLDGLSDVTRADLGRLASELPPLGLRRIRHVVSENARVATLAEALGRGDLQAVGAALYASHESLRRDYQVSCPESDFLVESSRTLEGMVGARMTGAGWGGCTLHLVREDHGARCEAALVGRFEARFGRRPRSWRLRAEGAARLLSD